MKKFSFPLDRVLSWRQTQARLEQAVLASLSGELQALDLRLTASHESVLKASAGLLSAASTTVAEIGALEHYRSFANAQSRGLLQARGLLEQKIAQQTQKVQHCRRDAQLLERLREHRLKDWHTAVASEVEQQAEESFLARFLRATPLQ